ncbi:MAG: DUF421 domain-containing protein [Methanosarcina sp.]|jgi:uncharacterized membrane protein YcaP (DUF421 family)
MAESSIEVFEITRILVADTPWHFLLEVIIRSVFMFIFALIIMRFLGRRAIHQLTSFDLLLIIALGSAMGDPMIYPNVAILWSVFGITSIMVLYRIQNALANRYAWYEDLTEGSPVKIITDGILNSKELKKHTLIQDDIFLLLRNEGIRSLGEIEAAYLERDGSLSVFKFRTGKQKPGLPTVSEDIIQEWKPHKAGTKIENSGFHSCYKTGETIWLERGNVFPDCEGEIWVVSEEA